jgi:hypothetical protein
MSVAVRKYLPPAAAAELATCLRAVPMPRELIEPAHKKSDVFHRQ